MNASPRDPDRRRRLVEYFTLRSASVAAKQLDARSLARAMDEVRAALDEAKARFDEAEADEALEALDRAERLWRARIAEPFTAIAPLVAPYAPPAEDARRTIATFAARHAALDRALDRLGPVRRGAAARWALRARRWASVALVLVALGSFARARLRRASLRATASASWSNLYSVDHTVDGDADTNWLLPDHRPGWVRVSFSSRTLRALRLYNVRRMPAYGAKLCTIEVERGGAVVHSARVDLTLTIGKREPLLFTLPSPTVADAVRVHVQTWHSLGGGLAEIELE